MIIYSGTKDTWFVPQNQYAQKEVFDNFMGASDFLESVERNEGGNMKNKDTYESLKYIYDTLGYTTGD